MGNFPELERILWFDQQVRKSTYPNTQYLARHFEVSYKTAQRTVDHMRDRLAAPLEYNPSERGYSYSDATFELPHFLATQEELLAILIARDLLSHSAGGIISQAINQFGKKLLAEKSGHGLTESQMKEAFSATWTGYSPTHPDTFQRVTDALLTNRVLQLSYTSPGTGKTSERTVEPYHLQHYMASWVLIARCRLRNEWRKFFLARMKDIRILEETFEPLPSAHWKHLIENSFGIFQGKTDTTVILHFTPFRARWIREQLWHPTQSIKDLPDGGLELSFPVSDFREVKMKILQFGADVEVVEPAALREEVWEEIQRMVGLYCPKNK
jgi:predicted DNA-binding transcriptional regulator YafY